jgi:excisionase family DNA binding protein
MSVSVFSKTPRSLPLLAVSPAEAAAMAGVGRTKLYEALRTGELPSFKIGKRRLVQVAQIQSWMDRLENGAQQKTGKRCR